MEGLPRREPVRSSLSGAVQVTPVLRNGSGVGGPASQMRLNTGSDLDAQIIDQLGSFTAGKMAEAVKVKQQRALVDGQMAYHQGRTLDQVQMDGDKWALEGYRMMDAQTLASGLFAAQKQEIADGLYELDPDAYRARMMDRLDGVLSGTKDKRTAELAREQFATQLGPLAEMHTVANLAYKERKNFESVEQGIDVISRDKTAITQLVSMAKGGPGSLTAGMSDDRRREAVVAGVIRAFENDNPLAYAALAREGLLKDNLTTEQINRVQNSRKAYENKVRGQYNEALFNGQRELMTQIENGQADPAEAVDKLQLLYAEHHIEMNRQEAGAIYVAAEDGVRTAKITRGAIIDEAVLRGDTDAAAIAIIDSLTGTESGGNSAAHRTNNDGRSFGGLIQMGQARLDDWSQATGAPRITVGQFKNMTADQQASINKWHIKSLMEQAQAKYGDRIGTQINGVTVTLSGMVAAAHLGGMGGLDALMKGDIREDQLGTSTLDYLRKHASGMTQEMFSPEQKMRMAQERLTETRERLALDVYAQITPQLDSLDQSYIAGETTHAAWKQQRDELYSAYSYARTKADVDHEIKVSRQANAAAQETITEENMFTGGAALRASQERFEGVVSAYERGEATTQDVQNAAKFMQEERRLIQQSFDMPFKATQELGEMDRINSRMSAAMDTRRVFMEEGVQIEEAVATHSLDKLSPKLQARAISEFRARLQEDASNMVGRFVSPEVANAHAAAQMHEFLGKSNVVDPRMKAAMNGSLTENLLDKDGNPNPNVVAAMENYKAIRDINPSLAAKYVSEENTARVAAILNRAGGNSIAEAVRSVGAARGNVRAMSATEYVNQPEVQDRITRSVNNEINTSEIGVVQAVFSQSADLSQVADSPWLNTDISNKLDNAREMREAIHRRAEQIATTDQSINPGDLVGLATEDVARRSAFVNGKFLMGGDNTDFGDMFFGGAAPEMMAQDGAIGSAVAMWMRSPEARQAYPQLAERPGLVSSIIDGPLETIGNIVAPIAGLVGLDTTGDGKTTTLAQVVDGWVSDLPPYDAWFDPQTGGLMVQVTAPDGTYMRPIAIPTREAGAMYIKHRKAEANGK